MATDQPRRRPHGEVKTAVRNYLARKSDPASISEIRTALETQLGKVADSSYRSCLQDERYFVRVSRGVFKLRDQA